VAAIGAIALSKPTKVTLFTIILDNLENKIRYEKSFCHPLFCLSITVKYISSLLQQRNRYEIRLTNITETVRGTVPTTMVRSALGK